MLFDGHNGYITASYALTALVFIILSIWVLSDRAKQKKALAKLERQGIIRQDKGKTDP